MSETLEDHPGHAGEVDSLQELRPLHVALLQEWAGLDDALKSARAEAFRQTASAAGRWIKNLDERDSAQSLLDYWTATMAGLASSAAYPKLVTLAPFDPSTVQTSSRDSPFVGLDPFRVKDRGHFHGRDLVRDELLAASEANPLLVVTGPSGLGKSSLIQAGVAGALCAEPRWKLFGPTSPGSDPVAAMLRAVRPDGAAPGWLDDQRDRLESDPEHLRILAESNLAADQSAVLVVDRAEEIFTFDVGIGEISVAAAALAAFVAGPQPGRHRVILDIREDYFEQLNAALKAAKLELPETAVARPRQPTPEELAEAVVKPAEAIGLKIDPAVTEALIADLAGQADALPLLEFTLSKLWDAAETDRLGMAEYQEVGRPSLIVQTVAERVHAGLDDTDSQETARLAFLELIRVGRYVSRRRLRRDDLREALEKSDLDVSRLNAVLKAFDKAGLLRRIPGDNSGDDCFEIAHEAVIRNWPRLLIWLQDRRRGDEARERAMAALERWRGGGRSPVFLLRGEALEEALPFKGDSLALGEFIAKSQWWWRIFAAVKSIVLLLVAVGFVWLGITLLNAWKGQADTEANRSRTASALNASQSQAENSRQDELDEASLNNDARHQMMLSDHALARLVEIGRISEADLPEILRTRYKRIPTPLDGSIRGYDPNFLADGGARNRALPLPRPLPRPEARLVPIAYPHATVLYDTNRRQAVLVAVNFDRSGAPMRPFNGIGFFPDPRLPAGQQSALRVSRNADIGLVPLTNFQEVGWTTGTGWNDESFLNFAPLAIMQPWRLYHGPWASIEAQLLASDSSRITIFTGAVHSPDDPVLDGVRMPQQFWKIAVYWDRSGARRVEAYLLGVNAGTAAEGSTTVAAIARIARIDFGTLASAPAPTTAAGPAGRTTVYMHFAGMPRSTAIQIRRALAASGYVMRNEVLIDQAIGQHQVRYGRAEDEPAATILADRTNAELARLGFRNVRVTAVPLQTKRVPPPGVIELWLDPTPH